MRFAHLAPFVPLAALLSLAGCAAFGDGDSSSSSSSTTSSSPASTSSNSSSERRASSADSSRDDKSSSSSSRDGRSTTSSSTGSDAGKGDLVTQLNEATRELAVLRAANAKLRAEKSSAPAPAPASSASSSSSAPRATTTPADDKLNQTLRSYTQFRQELTAIVADIEKLRSDNATLSSQLKEASTKAQQASSAAAKLEKDLATERAARGDAEKTIASLREQLRAVAKAVKEAGVPLDPAARSGK